jgi:hypothetical protein
MEAYYGLNLHHLMFTVFEDRLVDEKVDCNANIKRLTQSHGCLDYYSMLLLQKCAKTAQRTFCRVVVTLHQGH